MRHIGARIGCFEKKEVTVKCSGCEKKKKACV